LVASVGCQSIASYYQYKNRERNWTSHSHAVLTELRPHRAAHGSDLGLGYLIGFLDPITQQRPGFARVNDIDYIAMFMADDDTDAVVIFGEPGTRSEHEVTDMLRDGACTKPVVALLAGEFQENYPPGVSFGSVAAMINADSDSVSAKRKMLADAGALIARRLCDIPKLLRERHGDAC
jgi:hypothetical protein